MAEAIVDQFAPRLVAGYVDKILKGAKSGDLAMQAPARSEIVVNLKTAQTVGLIGCGYLPNRLFAVAGKHTLARRGV